ncbi:hypothetical protein HYALB_00009456 [Hymenoscyphus albidus]|uniref:Uncharacterized protein n=1 Tax=Hymenoscyphus albidus TaxID=595503 RepID=A0A9N9LT29_9HELO|nr:hypothetical protein HYALB_00009456 [Hymenoscyphus albidus]
MCIMSHVTKQPNNTTRALTMTRKSIKKTLLKKDSHDPFLRTVKVQSEDPTRYVDFKMRLDTGCEVHDLIASEVVAQLNLKDKIEINEEAICDTLNGEQLCSIGTIRLHWKGKRFRKIFDTKFHEDKANRSARKEEHRKECEKNDTKKAAHKKKKDGDKDAGRREESSSNGS